MVYDAFFLPPPSTAMPGKPVNEGLTLEDSPYEFPRDRLNDLSPGWELMVRATGGEDLWVKIISSEPGGFVCQVVPVPTDTAIHGLNQGDLVFVRPRNIESAAGGTAFERNGNSFEEKRATIQPLPGGQAVSYYRSSLFIDGDD